jgi:radical SAM superfamily enzyme YgiQ (UPF0313 family)
MNINLVFPNIHTPLSFSPALQIISAVLKKEGHIVTLTHINKDMIPNEDKDIMEDIIKNNPDLIGFTSTSFEYNRVNELAGIIKNVLNIPIILGGVHATISTEDFKDSNFDAFIVGEGEKIIVDIANGKVEPKGILYGESTRDLNELPFFDWDLFDSKKIIESKNGWLDINLSRGCPFKCAFCCNDILNKIKKISYTRRRNVDNSINEILYVMSRFNVSVISFLDDEFLADRKWLLEFLNRFIKEIKLTFKIEARVDTFDEDKAKLLKKSGCIEIQFGVESGSEKVREFLYKRITDQDIEEAFNLCRKYKINTYAYIMIGIPIETEEDLEETFIFLSKIRPNIIRPTFLCPVKGTKIYDYCYNNDLFKKNVTVWNYESPLKLKVSDDIIRDYWVNFPNKINKYIEDGEYYKYKEEDNIGEARYNRLELVTNDRNS